MFEVEVVTVKPNTEDGEPVRWFEQADSIDAAQRAAEAVLRQWSQISVAHHISAWRAGDQRQLSVAYTGPHKQIIGYVNIVEVADE